MCAANNRKLGTFQLLLVVALHFFPAIVSDTKKNTRLVMKGKLRLQEFNNFSILIFGLDNYLNTCLPGKKKISFFLEGVG